MKTFEVKLFFKEKFETSFERYENHSLKTSVPRLGRYISSFEFINAGVLNETRTAPFYYMTEVFDGYWVYDQLGSFRYESIYNTLGRGDIISEMNVSMYHPKDFITKFDIKKIDFLMIDIQGLDLIALTAFLEASKPNFILFENTLVGKNLEDFLAALEKLSKEYIIGDIHGSWSDKKEGNIWCQKVTGNFGNECLDTVTFDNITSPKGQSHKIFPVS